MLKQKNEYPTSTDVVVFEIEVSHPWVLRENSYKTQYHRSLRSHSNTHTSIFKIIRVGFVVYYESRKRELKIRLKSEGRCDERLKARVEGSTCLTDTGWVARRGSTIQLKKKKVWPLFGRCARGDEKRLYTKSRL